MKVEEGISRRICISALDPADRWTSGPSDPLRRRRRLPASQSADRRCRRGGVVQAVGADAASCCTLPPAG